MDSSRLHLVFDTRAGAVGIPDRRERIAPEDARLELRRILGSVQFDASDRNRRFLEYVVEETLMGRGDRIKAYSIATIVFGRDDSFDPALDPVVRMEARRLRRSLERFYLVEGQAGPVWIGLPKGGYVPRFQNSAELVVSAEQSPRPDVEWHLQNRGPSLLVSSFEEESGGRKEVACSAKLTRQIVVGLSSFPELTIFMPVSTGRARSDGDQRETLPPVDFVLAGNVIAEPHALKVQATLMLAHSGRIVWAETLVSDTISAGERGARDKLAERIICTLRDRMVLGQPAFGKPAVDRPETRKFSHEV